ncbi:hypothetical protein SLEP1_g11880 [Rubroshorea leprosula]|nr:hypothetical protein SLEP1_g11880 [Rubroshorea leprosula]
MEWVRGETIGYGSFGTVNLAMQGKSSVQGSSVLMAVKSAPAFDAGSLKNEKAALDQIGSCPEIIRCLGDNYSFENGGELYNVFLEFASKGCLADQVKRNAGGLGESDVRRHTRSILKGLRHIHAKGFAHCDIKLQNILVFENGGAKIADFGLAKKFGEEKKFEIRGTPLYMAPESVTESEYGSGVDIWALGCAVVEMATGKLAWNLEKHSNIATLMIKIGLGDESPEIPDSLCEEGKDFLKECFVKDPRNRLTADALLDHPFVAGDDTVALNCEQLSTSPRGPLDFPEWISVQSTTSPSPSTANSSFSSSSSCWVSSLSNRIHELACNQGPNWSVSDGSWVVVR